MPGSPGAAPPPGSADDRSLPGATRLGTDEVIAMLGRGDPKQIADVAFLVARRGTDLAGRGRLLRALADQGHWVWRGAVVDRAGRHGVAISAKPADPAGRTGDQIALVFDAGTGELLTYERMLPESGHPAGSGLAEYRMFLGARYVSEAGGTW